MQFIAELSYTNEVSNRWPRRAGEAADLGWNSGGWVYMASSVTAHVDDLEVPNNLSPRLIMVIN